MPVYQAILWFREDLDDEYRASRLQPLGKDMVGALGKVISTQMPLHAGDTYEIRLLKNVFPCRVIEMQPSMFGDPGSVTLEPVYGIVPRHKEEIFQIIDQLKAFGWE